MKRKPQGSKYRNLTARGGVIYYERLVRGQRIRFSTATGEWEAAAAVRDLYEQRKGIGTGRPTLKAPRFHEAAERYLNDGMSHLAETTREDRRSLLDAGGPLVDYFGQLRLDDVTRGT